jgi:hypothetical protein
LGIFPYNGLSEANSYMQTVINNVNTERQTRGYASITINDIKCATTPVFNSSISSFSTTPFTRVNSIGVTENGQKSSFSMKMDLGDGTFRCSAVSVYKTYNYRQIIARGFTSCANGNNYTSIIERAIINTTETQ